MYSTSNMLNSKQIEIFYHIYKEGSITKAANVLNVSQPALSKSISYTEKKLGFNFPVFVFVRLEKQRATNFSDFENEIKRFSEVVECWLMTGSQDYLLKIITKDVTEFERFLTLKLTTIEGVSSVDSSVPLRCAKQSHHRIE